MILEHFERLSQRVQPRLGSSHRSATSHVMTARTSWAVTSESRWEIRIGLRMEAVSSIRPLAARVNRPDIEILERAIGIEPTTFSLGS